MSKICANCGKKLKFLDGTIETNDKKIIGEECYSKVFEGGISSQVTWGMNHSFADFKNIYDQGEMVILKEANRKEKEHQNQKKVAEKQSREDEKNQQREKLKEEKEQQKSLEESMKQKFKEHNAVQYGHIYFDDVDKELMQTRGLMRPYIKRPYSDVISYSPVDRGHSEHKKHGITRAVTGGMLFGGVGAVVGATTGGKNFEYVDEIGVNISLKNGDSLSIKLLRTSTKAGFVTKEAYSECNQLCALLDSILAENNQNSDDVTDQLRKLKSLVDDGILTQEEFDVKKKQLLNI